MKGFNDFFTRYKLFKSLWRLSATNYLKVYGSYLLPTQSHEHSDAAMQVNALTIRIDWNTIYLSNL